MFGGYFEWNACTHFQKTCRSARYNNSKFIRDIPVFFGMLMSGSNTHFVEVSAHALLKVATKRSVRDKIVWKIFKVFESF